MFVAQQNSNRMYVPVKSLNLTTTAASDSVSDPKRLQLEHDMFTERVLFLYECLQKITEAHVICLRDTFAKITAACTDLLAHPHGKVRICAFDIVAFLAQRLHEGDDMFSSQTYIRSRRIAYSVA